MMDTDDSGSDTSMDSDQVCQISFSNDNRKHLIHLHAVFVHRVPPPKKLA